MIKKTQVEDCIAKFELDHPELDVTFKDKSEKENNKRNFFAFEPLTLSKLVKKNILEKEFLNLFDDKWFQKTAKVKYFLFSY